MTGLSKYTGLNNYKQGTDILMPREDRGGYCTAL